MVDAGPEPTYEEKIRVPSQGLTLEARCMKPLLLCIQVDARVCVCVCVCARVRARDVFYESDLGFRDIVSIQICSCDS